MPAVSLNDLMSEGTPFRSDSSSSLASSAPPSSTAALALQPPTPVRPAVPPKSILRNADGVARFGQQKKDPAEAQQPRKAVHFASAENGLPVTAVIPFKRWNFKSPQAKPQQTILGTLVSLFRNF